MTRGFYYVAVGQPWLAEAVRLSICSLRCCGCNDPVIVSSDESFPRSLWPDMRVLNYSLLDLAVPSGNSTESRIGKFEVLERTPWDQVCYLDADTIICRNPSEIWEYLADGRIAMALDRLPTVALSRKVSPRFGRLEDWDETMWVLANRSCDPKTTAQYNGGVIVLARSIYTTGFMQAWHEQWKKFRHMDQPPMIRTIANFGLRVAELPPQFNAQSPLKRRGRRYPPPLAVPAVIRHFTGSHGVNGEKTLKEMRSKLATLSALPVDSVEPATIR